MKRFLDMAEKEDIENSRLKEQMVQKMCMELQMYLVAKKRGNMYKLRQLLQNGHEDPIYALEMEFFLSNDTYLRKFHEIAKRYGYFFKGDIQNVVTDVSLGFNQSDIEKWQKLLLLSSISYEKEKDRFRLETDFGNICFMEAQKRYPVEAEKMIERAKKEHGDVYKKSGLSYLCHFTALEFIHSHPDDYFITCMCPHIFTSTWWLHSYILTQDEKTVIDFANNIVMEREVFDKLFEPNNLVKIKKADLEVIKTELSMLSLPYVESKVLSNLTRVERAKQLYKKNEF